MNKKLYKTIGRPFINLPSTQKNKFNNKHRNIGENDWNHWYLPGRITYFLWETQ